MKKNELSVYLSMILFISLSSIFLCCCIGCGGLKKGETIADQKKSVDASTELEELSSAEKTKVSNARPDDVEVSNNPIKAKKRHLKFNEAKAKKEAQMRFPDHKFRGSARGDTVQYLYLQNEVSLSLEYLAKYTYRGDFLETIDLNALNPYRKYIDYDRVEGTYHHMLGNNIIVNGTKEKVESRVPEILYDLTPDDFYISAINPYTTVEKSPDGTKLLIRYSYHLLPGEEILEHQTYPGINTYVVINLNTGEEINRLSDLAFIPYYEVLTNDGKYLIVAHTKDMTGADFSVREEDWKHQASVYNIFSGKLCYQIEGSYECTTLLKSELGMVGFICYDNPPELATEVSRHYIFNNHIISKKFNTSLGYIDARYSTSEYEAFRTEADSIIKYDFDKDFIKNQKLCN